MALRSKAGVRAHSQFPILFRHLGGCDLLNQRTTRARCSGCACVQASQDEVTSPLTAVAERMSIEARRLDYDVWATGEAPRRPTSRRRARKVS